MQPDKKKLIDNNIYLFIGNYQFLEYWYPMYQYFNFSASFLTDGKATLRFFPRQIYFTVIFPQFSIYPLRVLVNQLKLLKRV